MPNVNLEDHLGESSHLSSLIIEEILSNIITSSLSVSPSTKPLFFDPANDFTDLSVPRCSEDTSVSGEAMENGPKKTKSITFSEDVTVVYYEQVSQTGDDNSERECLKMKEDHKMETEVIKGEEEFGSRYDNQVGLDGENADFRKLKRKCNDSVLEDDFVIPMKAIKPEADSHLGSQDEDGAKLHASHIHSDENKAKEEKADQQGVETDLEVNKHQERNVVILNRESDFGHATTANRVASITFGCPSDEDRAGEDSQITVPLCSGDDAVIGDIRQCGMFFSNDDIIDDCRSVLQSIVDITTHRMLQGTSLGENSDDTSEVAEQPPTKKIKLALSHIQASKTSLPVAEAKDSSPNNVPFDVDTSTEDVKQLHITAAYNTKACLQEATALYDNITLDEKSGQGCRSLQDSSDSADESTSTPDVMAKKEVKTLTVLAQADVTVVLSERANVVENNNLLLNNDFKGEDYSYTSTVDVEEADNDPDISKHEPDTYSYILAQDLQLDESEECSEQPECFKIELQGTKGGTDCNSLLSSSDVEVVKSEDVYVDAIELSLQEDIMPSPGSSDDDFSCTFQTASQVLANSQDEMTCSQSLGKFNDMPSKDLNLIASGSWQVPSSVPFSEGSMQDVVLGDWKTFLGKDDSISKVPEIFVPDIQGHAEIQEKPINHQYGGSEAECASLELPEYDFLQVLGLSPKQKLNEGEEEGKSCDFCPSETMALPSLSTDWSPKDREEAEEIEPSIPLLHPIYGYLDCSPMDSSRLNSSAEMTVESGRAELLPENLASSPVHGSHMEPAADVEITAELSIIEVNISNDQTVPSLQTPQKQNPSIDQLLELEESIFSEQDTDLQDGPIKSSILDQEKTPGIKGDSEDKPIPDHLQTLGQTAAGVFLWNHSLPDPSLTPSITQDQNNLQNTAHNQTPPITPVRPLPVCQRRRRIGLSRRQLVYPLHARTVSRK